MVVKRQEPGGDGDGDGDDVAFTMRPASGPPSPALVSPWVEQADRRMLMIGT
jgi:hypothetical protein